MAAPNRDESADAERVVVLGRIGGAFGVSGWVKLESYTDPPSNLFQYPVWLLRNVSGSVRADWLPQRPAQTRMAGRGLQAQLEGVATREQAAELSGSEIGVRRGELPQLPPGQYYWDDLIGLEALSLEGEPLGEIAEIRAAPAHPLLRLVDKRQASGDAYEAWVPLVPERIKGVDLQARRAVIDWRRDW